MSTDNFTIRVRVAWWLEPYLCTLAFFAGLMGREPNWAKLERVVARAITVRLEPT